MATRRGRRPAWQAAIDRLASGDWVLFGLWGDGSRSTWRCSITAVRPASSPWPAPTAASRRSARGTRRRSGSSGRSRTCSDISPSSALDTRRWLDHGRWGVKHPLGQAVATPADGAPYPFLPAEGPGLHQIPVGPVHAGIIEPGHFRFTANGETVVRLEERLGYVHKGIEGLMAGADLAHGGAPCRTHLGRLHRRLRLRVRPRRRSRLEAEPPARAVWLRALMAELERLANHFGDIGAICNDAAFALMHAHCGMLRERVLRAADCCFGHRLMRDRIVPGGVAADLDAAGAKVLRDLVRHIKATFPALIELYDNTASLQDRTVATGVLTPELARQYGCGGYVGRASGRNFDVRRALPYPPYDCLYFEVAIRSRAMSTRASGSASVRSSRASP